MADQPFTPVADSGKQAHRRLDLARQRNSLLQVRQGQLGLALRELERAARQQRLHAGGLDVPVLGLAQRAGNAFFRLDEIALAGHRHAVIGPQK